MICFDEFGPIEVRPYHGRAWRRVRHPARLRATYRRLHGTRLYLVLDNFSPHKRPEVRDWAADHNVELVFTPTYASWLNRIEAIFSGVRYFALDNSDYRDHEQSRRAILAYVAWRNRHRHTALVKRRENTR